MSENRYDSVFSDCEWVGLVVCPENDERHFGKEELMGESLMI